MPDFPYMLAQIIGKLRGRLRSTRTTIVPTNGRNTTTSFGEKSHNVFYDPFEHIYYSDKLNMLDRLTSVVPKEEIAGLGLIKKIGQGGFGEVFLVQGARLEKGGHELHALKRLRSDKGISETAFESFMKEAVSMVQLDQTGCLEYQDIVRPLLLEKGQVYIKTPYCIGGSLAGRMKAAPIATHDAISFLLQLACIINHFNEKKVVHRDIKPGNILFQYEHQQWTLVVSDFGISAMMGSGTHKAGSIPLIVPNLGEDKNIDEKSIGCKEAPVPIGRAIMKPIIRQLFVFPSSSEIHQGSSYRPIGGSPLNPVQSGIPYGAPEQFQGLEPTGAMDVWAWGCIAWELLTGMHPFEPCLIDLYKEKNQCLAFVERVRKFQLPDEALKASEIPNLLRRTINESLSLDPKERPSALEILDMFSKCCCVSLFADINQYVGSPPGDAHFCIKGGGVFTFLESYGWPSKGNLHVIKMSMGWLHVIREAERLQAIGNVFGMYKAIESLKRLLGEPGDPRSVLYGMINNPELKVIEIHDEKLKMVVGGEVHNIPKSMALHAYDLLCTCLVNICGDDEPKPENILYLQEVLALWELMKQFDSYIQLAHLSQAHILVGDPAKAVRYMLLASEKEPEQVLHWQCLMTAAGAMGEFEKEKQYALFMLSKAKSWHFGPNMEYSYMILSVVAALAAGNLGDAAMIFQNAQKNNNIVELALRLTLVRRMGIEIDEGSWSSISPYIREANNQHLNLRRCFVEYAWYSGDIESCRSIAREALSTPQMHLTINRCNKVFFEQFVSENEPVFSNWCSLPDTFSKGDWEVLERVDFLQ